MRNIKRDINRTHMAVKAIFALIIAIKLACFALIVWALWQVFSGAYTLEDAGREIGSFVHGFKEATQ